MITAIVTPIATPVVLSLGCGFVKSAAGLPENKVPGE
jgi:hypothetical protein